MALPRLTEPVTGLQPPADQLWHQQQVINDQIEAVMAPGGASGLGDPGGNGMLVRTALGVTDNISLVAPAAGFTITNPSGVSGGGGADPTFALANDLAALEALSGTGFAKRTGADTWSVGALVSGDIPDLSGTYQPLDADLTAIAGLSPSNDDIIQRKSGAWTNRTPAQFKVDLALVSGDVGLGNVTNDAQTKAAIVPNALPSSGQILIGNAGGTGYAPVGVSGDVTISNAGVTAIGALKVTNAMLAGSIAYSKLSLTGAILNADLAGSIAASKLVGTDIATVGTLTAGATGAGFTVALSTSTITGTLADARLSANVAFRNAANSFAGHQTPSVSDTYDLGSPTLLWRKGWLSELDAVLFAQNTVSVIGGWLMIAKGEGAIPAGADVSAADTQIDFGQSMTLGDFVLFRAAGKVEYVSVTSVVSATRYVVTRNLDGSGANDWPAGSVYVILGQSGTGRIELNANSTPRISMFTQGATYNSQTELLRLGDLNGWSNYASEIYGFATGDPSAANITIDATNGLRIRQGTTNKIVLDAAGNASFTGSVTATSGNIGGFDIGADYVRDAANSFGLASTVTGGDDVRFWAGDTFANRATAPFRLTEAGALVATSATITGAITATSGSFTGAITASSGSITGPLTMSGASSSIAIGATPPSSATVGTGLWLDRTGMYGLASNVQQAIFDAATGAITAGAGKVVLNSAGLSITQSGSSADYINWKLAGGTTFGWVVGNCVDATIGVSTMSMVAKATQASGQDLSSELVVSNQSGSLTGRLVLQSDDAGATSYVYLTDVYGVSIASSGPRILPAALLDVRGDGLFRHSDAATAAFTDLLTLGHNSSGTPAANFGGSILWKLESSTTGDRDAARIGALWTTATDASRSSAFVVQTVYNAGSLTETYRFGANSVQEIIGPVATLARMPRLNFKFTSDADAAISFLNYDHDNIAISFDAHHDGANWVSSDAGSNFAVYKTGDELIIGYNAGTAKGSAFGAGFNLTGGAAFNSAGAMRLGNVAFQAAGTLAAKGVYDDGVLLTDWIFDLHYDGQVKPEDSQYAAKQLYSISETDAFTREYRHLPSLPGRKEWAQGTHSLGQMVTAFWETIERLQLQNFELHERLRELEKKPKGALNE